MNVCSDGKDMKAFSMSVNISRLSDQRTVVCPTVPVPLTLACFISSSAISMRFFLKATTRLPLKLVSSRRKTLWSLKRAHVVHTVVGRQEQVQNMSTSVRYGYTNLSSQTLKACQISAGSAAGDPLPEECPCFSVEPYPKPC